MSHTEQRLSPGTQIGDYLLRELHFEGPTTRTWLATQISVNREVVIDSLNRAAQGDDAIVNTFLSDVRTKAKVDHPLIGSVFEAVREKNICFYTREKITGKPLQSFLDEGAKFTPEQVVHLLGQLAEANLYLENHNVASLPLSPAHIFISSTNMCRVINMAVGGQRDHSVSTQDKQMLGNVFLSMLQKDAPGATRTRSLLGYMVDTKREIPLTWDQIRELSQGVERQLSEPPAPKGLDSQTMKLQKKAYSKRLVMSAGIALGVLIAGGIAMLFMNSGEKPPKQRTLEDEVFVKAGNYRGFDNTHNRVNPFMIDSHEVTIAEYAEFLHEAELLEPEMLEKFQHENHPDYKESHLPHDWDALYKAAKTGDTWNGIKVTLNCPVVNVDWWDAYTFASFHNRRLPTQEEWLAALQSSQTKPNELKVSPWGPVDQEGNDITKNGIHGLAGNVSEWSLKRTKPTHDPTATQKLPVILGAAYNQPIEGATKREWLDQSQGLLDPRDIRRSNLGFRTVGQPNTN